MGYIIAIKEIMLNIHNQTKIIDANSNIELYTYDYRGNVTKKVDRREL